MWCLRRDGTHTSERTASQPASRAWPASHGGAEQCRVATCGVFLYLPRSKEEPARLSNLAGRSACVCARAVFVCVRASVCTDVYVHTCACMCVCARARIPEHEYGIGSRDAEAAATVRDRRECKSSRSAIALCRLSTRRRREGGTLLSPDGREPRVLTGCWTRLCRRLQGRGGGTVG